MFTGPHFNRPEGIIGSQYLDPLSRPSTHASPDSNCREEPGSLESRTPPRRVHVDSDIREFWPYRRPVTLLIPLSHSRARRPCLKFGIYRTFNAGSARVQACQLVRSSRREALATEVLGHRTS